MGEEEPIQLDVGLEHIVILTNSGKVLYSLSLSVLSLCEYVCVFLYLCLSVSLLLSPYLVSHLQVFTLGGWRFCGLPCGMDRNPIAEPGTSIATYWQRHMPLMSFISVSLCFVPSVLWGCSLSLFAFLASLISFLLISSTGVKAAYLPTLKDCVKVLAGTCLCSLPSSSSSLFLSLSPSLAY